MKSSFTAVHRFFWLMAIFCIAMGFLEAIVVVYLRQLYYPLGFDFPLSLLSPKMLGIEWVRELATIIMLTVIGILAGKDKIQKFLYFLFCFAVWDLFYYLGLKLFLNWPSSFFSWDVLFLIPLPWVSPVLAPVICSLTMIFFAVSTMYMQKDEIPIKISPKEWRLLISGSFIILYTFMSDYFKILFQNIFLSDVGMISRKEYLWQVISQHKPGFYNWYLFSLGEVIIIVGILLVIKRMKSTL